MSMLPLDGDGDVSMDGQDPMSSSGLPTLESYSTVDTPDPGTASRPYSPMPAVGSVEDVQAYFTQVVQDVASDYNTEYEDRGEGDHEGSSVGGADIGIDEELAQLA